MNFIRALMSSGLVRARALKYLRGASMFVGAWTLSHLYDWLVANMTFFSQADDMAIAGTVSAATAGLVLTIGSAIFSQTDATKVDAKMTIAAATGSVEAANNSATVKQVIAASGSPEALQQVVEVLKSGGE